MENQSLKLPVWMIIFTIMSSLCLGAKDAPNEIEFLRDLLYFKDLRGYSSSSKWDMEDYVTNRLAEIGLPAVDMLSESLKIDEGFVRYQAEEALSKIKASQALEALKTSPNSPGNIYNIKKTEKIENLIVVLKDEDWNKRCYAAELLAQRKDSRSVDPLIQVLNDDGEKDISEFKKKLAASNSDSVEIEILMLKGSILRCHQNAALALGYIGTDNAFKSLQELVNRKDENYKIIAARALSLIAKPEASTLLLTLTGDKSLQVRYIAYEALGNQKTADSIKALQVGLRDVNPEIRTLVIQLLAEYKEPALNKVYIGIIKNEKECPIAPAIRAIIGCEDPEISKILLEASFRENMYDQFIMEASVEVLKSKKDPYVTQALLKKLQSNNDDDSDRTKAAKMLGGLEDPSAKSVFQKILREDKDPFIKEAAAEALGQYNDPNLLGDLINAVEKSSPWTNKGAVKALGNYKEKEAIQVLSEVALKDEEWGVRTAAVESLDRIQDPLSLEVLIAAMNDKERAVRKAAAAALGKIDNSKATDALIKALDTEGKTVNGREVGSWEVCNAAAVALGKSRDPNLQQKLIQLFHSENYAGRIEAVYLLVQRGWRPASLNEWIQFDIAAGLFDVVHEKGPAAVEPLIAATQEKDWRWIGGAAKALGRTKDKRAIEPLIRVLSSENWPRQEAAKALKEFGDDRAVKALINALNDEDWHLRAAAAEALGGYKQPEVKEALRRAINDPHPRVKDAALKSLENK